MGPIEQSRRRLSCQHGHWVLETSTLVRLERDVYGPQRRNIQGTEAILSHLRSRGEGGLVSGAEQLIRGTGQGSVAFEEKDGSWVESSPSLAPANRSDQLEAEVTELRAEVILLRAVCSGLTSRLGRIERWLMKGGGKHEVSAALNGRGQSVTQEQGDQAEHSASHNARAPVSSSGDHAAPLSSPDPAQKASLGEEPKPNTGDEAHEERSPEPPQLEPSISLPGGPAVMTCLRQLTGEPIHLDMAPDKLPSSKEAMALFQAALLVDDEGRDRAALLADNRAIVQCGGLLLGLPKTAIAEMADAGESTPDLLLAMSEIFNNLSGVVNHEQGNPHLRAQALEQAAISRLPWLAAPAAQVGFRTPNGGQIWLVAC